MPSPEIFEELPRVTCKSCTERPIPVDLWSQEFNSKWLLILIHPGSANDGTALSLLNIFDKITEFFDLNCQVLALSTESWENQRSFFKTKVSKGGLGSQHAINLLCDEKGELCDLLGALDKREGERENEKIPTAYPVHYIYSLEKKLLEVCYRKEKNKEPRVCWPITNEGVDELLRSLRRCRTLEHHAMEYEISIQQLINGIDDYGNGKEITDPLIKKAVTVVMKP